MELLTILGLSAIFANPCSWDNPGHNPYVGKVETAINNYQDIPPAIRTTLIAKIQKDEYDDLVAIKRDSIEGNSSYDPNIKGMHFGKDRTCSTITRSKWSSIHSEPAKVYCSGPYCIAVPKVCNNISRITRSYSEPVASTGGAGGGGGGGGYGQTNYPHNWYKPVEYGWVTPVPEQVVPFVSTPPSVPVPVLTPPYNPGSGWVVPIKPPIIPSVPEPEVWKYYLLALLVIAVLFVRSKR